MWDGSLEGLACLCVSLCVPESEGETGAGVRVCAHTHVRTHALDSGVSSPLEHACVCGGSVHVCVCKAVWCVSLCI